ncbi:glycosyltransferase family 9 protein [Hydrogenobaculum acidophilum]
MSVIVKVSREVYIEDLKKTMLPNKLYVLPKDVYESYVKTGVSIEYVDSLKMAFDKTNDFNNKKILILSMQALGDGLMLTPFLRFLKENFQNIHITLETKEHFNLLKDCPYVDEFAYSPLELSFVKSFDTILDLYMLVGSPMFDLNLVSSYYFKLFGFGIPEDKNALIPYVYIDKEKDDEIKHLFDEYRKIYKKPILGFHFSASSPHRMPPVDIFCNAIAPLQKFFTIVYSYPSQHKDYAREIPNYLPKAIDISTYIKSVQHLPSYVKNLDFLISVETVLPHIAVAVKTPTLVVLGPGSFKNIYDYGLDYIKALEMNYKGQVCASPCHLHVSTRCPEAVVKQTNLSPCFSNLNPYSLVESFFELLKAINKENNYANLLKSLESEIALEYKATKAISSRLSTIPISFYYESGLNSLAVVPHIKTIMSFILNALFEKSISYKDLTPILIVRGYETLIASMFLNALSPSFIYVENEHFKKLLYYLGIKSNIIDYDILNIREHALVIDISLSSEEPFDYKEHIRKLSKKLKKDSLFFSFVFNKDRMKKALNKGQDIYQPPFDRFINEYSYEELLEFKNFYINTLSSNPVDFTNTFGEYSLFKEISPHNQAFRLLIKENKYPYIYALSNLECTDDYENITRFYSFIEKTYIRPDFSVFSNISGGSDVKSLCFVNKNISGYLKDYVKNSFEEATFLEFPAFDKNIFDKYLASLNLEEKQIDLENIWFIGDEFIDYFKQDANFLKNILFGPKINVLLDKNPFSDNDYLNTFKGFLRDYPDIDFYTTQKGVFDILSKKHQNLKYFDIDFSRLELSLNSEEKTVDLLIISSSAYFPTKKTELDVEEFYSSYINGFSKNIQKLVLDFIKDKTGKKDIYYEDLGFLDFYKDIINHSASLNYFIAQEIRNIALKFTKNILHVGVLNFKEPRFLKELAVEHVSNSRYIPDILITKEEYLDDIMARSKLVLYLDGLDNFQRLPLTCLKASKQNIPCITKYQKSLENIPNLLLVKNIEELIGTTGLLLKSKI